MPLSLVKEWLGLQAKETYYDRQLRILVDAGLADAERIIGRAQVVADTCECCEPCGCAQDIKQENRVEKCTARGEAIKLFVLKYAAFHFKNKGGETDGDFKHVKAVLARWRQMAL